MPVELVLAAIFVLLVVYGRRWHRGYGRQAELARLSEPERRRHEEIQRAEQELARLTKKHRKAVRRAEREVKAAAKPRRLAKVGPVRLTELDITVNDRTAPLRPSTDVRVEESGSLVVLPADHKGKVRKVDTRELYLIVTDTDFHALAKLPPDRRAEVLDLVGKAGVAARQVDTARRELADRVRQAEEHLARVREEDRAVVQARNRRESLGADPLVALREAWVAGGKDGMTRLPGSRTWDPAAPAPTDEPPPPRSVR